MLYRLIIGLFLRLPWWIYVGFAVGMGNLTYNLYNSEFEKQQLGLARAEQPAPQSVDLSKFDPERDIHPLDEVHVRGWPDFDYNYQLIKKRNGIETSRRFMYVFFGQDDLRGTRDVRAVILLRKNEKDLFVDQAEQMVVGMKESNFIYEVNGFEGGADGFSSLMNDSLKKEGLVKADNFIIIEPFLYGRSEALTTKHDPKKTLIYCSGLTLFLTLVAQFKYTAKLRRKRALRAAAAS